MSATVTTQAAIMDAARVIIATKSPALSPAELFQAHNTNQPFEKAPISKRNGFAVTGESQVILQEFGLQNSKVCQFSMVVRIGHPPFQIDVLREDGVANDIDKLSDVVEDAGWQPAGIYQVFFEGASTDKTDPNWWLTKLVFRIVYLASVKS